MNQEFYAAPIGCNVKIDSDMINVNQCLNYSVVPENEPPHLIPPSFAYLGVVETNLPDRNDDHRESPNPKIIAPSLGLLVGPLSKQI